MADPARRRATYEELLAVPGHLVAEIVNGELVTSPRPAPRQARAASSLGGELHGPFDRGRNGPGGWIILDEPELHLHGDVLGPDLAGWRRERMPELPEAAAFELAPDWACEVLSPATASSRSGRQGPDLLEGRRFTRFGSWTHSTKRSKRFASKAARTGCSGRGVAMPPCAWSRSMR